MKKLKKTIIANAQQLGVVKLINDAVAAVPALAQRAGDVPGVLRTITLYDLITGVGASGVPPDQDILAALRTASASELEKNGSEYVRSVRVAELLRVTTSVICRRMAHLEKTGSITSTGRVAGKRYAPVESESS